MEQQLKDTQATVLKTESLQGKRLLANYDHIELTEDEIFMALHKAKGEKDARLKTEAYKKKLFEVPVYEKMNFQQLKEFVTLRYNVIDVLDENFSQKLPALINEKSPYFILDDNNRDIFNTLCLYYSGDKKFEDNPEYSLKKGILFFGPVGCGKTSLMRMFSVNSFRPFTLVSCRTIADQYSKEGSDVLYSFSAMQVAYPHQNFGHKQTGRCFDDLGTEENKKNYGNEVNVMQDVLYKIYDNENRGSFHITTNLSGDEIELQYGTRIRSRMRELFNIVMFAKDSPDRRS